MKKIKFPLSCVLFIFIFTFFACVPEEKDNSGDKVSQEDKKTELKATIGKEFWGTWIQMDTGDEYYIDAAKIYKSNSSRKKYSELQNGIIGYTLEHENILKKGSIVFFRKGGSTRSFSMQVSGFSDSYSSRAISTGQQGVKGRRQSKENAADSQESTSSSDGKINFTGAVADDEQTVTVSDGVVTIKPQYDGENLGSIPVVEAGMYGFKTTYKINGDAQGYCYGNYYRTYKLSLDFNNIGSEICETSVYEISFDDNNLQVLSGDLTGNFSSVEPGKSKSVDISIRYGKLEEEYIDVPINILITDSKYSRTWKDSVTLRFHKGVVSLKVNSHNFDSSSNARLNGFVIYPDGRSNRFTVSADSTQSVLIPWSKSDYYLAFSGATSSNEMAYSFGFSKKTNLADLNGTWTIAEINAYESNDTLTSAYTVSDLTIPVKAYLKNGDIDFYKINNSEISIGFAPVNCVGYAVKEYANGNDDGLITPGESHYLDVKMHNETDSEISGVSVKLSTTSSYVTLERDSYAIGDMIAGGYYTLTDAYDNGSRYAGSVDLMDSYITERAFKFSVASSCPEGTEIPFAVTFTDSSGNTWTDNFNITVSGTKASIALVSGTNYEVKEYENGNADNLVTPGESLYLDIKVQNSGTSKTLGVTVKLSTTSSYVTLERDSYAIGDMIAGGYYTLTDAYDNGSRYAGSVDLMDSYYSARAFKFRVSSDCPDGTTLPFTVTFTDSSGNTWMDSFSITVKMPDVAIVVADYSFTDSTSVYSSNNGDDSINAGEKINMDIRLQNTGTSNALNVVTKLSTASPYLSFSDNICEYGTISGKYYKTSYRCSGTGYSSATDASYSLVSYPGYVFTISNSAPVDTVIPLNVSITDNHGNSWTETINLTVVEANVKLSYISCDFSDKTVSGTMNDNDGKIEAGEKIFLNACIKNSGTSRADNVVVSFSSDSNYIKFSTNSRNYGTIPSGMYKAYGIKANTAEITSQTPASNYACVFNLDSSVPSETQIPITVTMTDSKNETWTETFVINVQ